MVLRMLSAPARVVVEHVRLADDLVQPTTGTTALPEHVLIIVSANNSLSFLVGRWT